jgi:SH3-like domain-containing protein
MKEKYQQLVTLAVVLALATSLLFGNSALPAFAQAVDGTLNDLGEGGGRILTSDWTALNPGQQITYQVAYDGDEQPISIWMNSAPSGAVEFQIWTDDRLADLEEDAETEPLGRGTAMTDDGSFTNWQGGSPEAETYFVVVSNVGTTAARFLLNASSPALSLEQPGAVAVAPIAPTDPDIAVVTTDALNVRSGPSTAFPVLTTIPNGTQMTVLGRNFTNTWINVQLEDGTEGWVTRSLTSYTLVSPNVIAAALPGAAASVAATGTTTTTATSPLTTTAVVTATAGVTATELGKGWQVLGDGEVDWYTFQYRGGDLPLTIWMDMEPFEDASFTVVSADVAQEIMAGTTITPTTVIGSGRANPVEPGYLFWQAEFAEADTFYVMVQAENTAGGDVLYSINALGPGVGRFIEPVEEP